jgi:hypothetical protein
MYRKILVAGLILGALTGYAQPFSSYLSLDGSTDYADLGLVSLLPSGSDFTVEGWIRTCGSEGKIFDARESDNGIGLELGVTPGGQFHVVMQGPGGAADVTDTLAPNTMSSVGWHHFAFVHRAPDVNQLMIDGRVFLEFTQTFAPDDAFVIGRSDDVAAGFFDGFVDEFRVSDMARYFNGFNPNGPFTPDANTLALWHFDDSPGSIEFVDAGPIGHNLDAMAAATTRSGFSVSGGGSMCDGSSLPLAVSGGTGYVWSPSAGLDDPFSETPTANPTETTYYTVVASNRNSCEDIGLVGVVVREDPEAYASSAMPEICEGDRTQLFAEGGVSYAWDFGSVAQNPLVSPTETTTYSVDVTDVYGCTASAQVTVQVRSCESTSGIDDNSNIQLTVGPNPTWGELWVNLGLTEGADVNLSIVDALGRTLRTDALGTLPAGLHRQQIKTSLAPGSYWLLIDAGTERESLPFVVSF